MTPKEKAKEFKNKFNDLEFMEDCPDWAWKECALICVDELEKLADSVWEKLDDYHTVEYWQEVKQEIEKL